MSRTAYHGGNTETHSHKAQSLDQQPCKPEIVLCPSFDFSCKQEKAEALKAQFVELGKTVGAGTGEAAGHEAGKNIDPSQAVKDAVEAAKEAAEKAALR